MIYFFRLFSKEASKKETGAAVSAVTARDFDTDSDEELYQPTFAISRYNRIYDYNNKNTQCNNNNNNNNNN